VNKTEMKNGILNGKSRENIMYEKPKEGGRDGCLSSDKSAGAGT